MRGGRSLGASPQVRAPSNVNGNRMYARPKAAEPRTDLLERGEGKDVDGAGLSMRRRVRLDIHMPALARLVLCPAAPFHVKHAHRIEVAREARSRSPSP
jgi:hypothetical protein